MICEMQVFAGGFEYKICTLEVSFSAGVCISLRLFWLIYFCYLIKEGVPAMGICMWMDE